MARPARCRRICFEPIYDSFAPCSAKSTEQVFLTVDEFEAVRLIDHERKTHEQCARQMGISRTTVTEMYERARSKIADCLVNGKTLCISGGNYTLCDGSAWKCCGKKCSRAGQNSKLQDTARMNEEEGKCEAFWGMPSDDMAGDAKRRVPIPIKKEEDRNMKIAVTYENGNVFQHFGHTGQFKVFEIQDGKIAKTEIVDTNGNGHGALAGMLSALEVDTLICGGIGAGAQNALAEAGIRLYGGVSGSADEAVEALLAGHLAFNPDVHCDHHDHHGEGHHCGEAPHGCGGHGSF